MPKTLYRSELLHDVGAHDAVQEAELLLKAYQQNEELKVVEPRYGLGMELGAKASWAELSDADFLRQSVYALQEQKGGKAVTYGIKTQWGRRTSPMLEPGATDKLMLFTGNDNEVAVSTSFGGNPGTLTRFETYEDQVRVRRQHIVGNTVMRSELLAPEGSDLWLPQKEHIDALAIDLQLFMGGIALRAEQTQ